MKRLASAIDRFDQHPISRFQPRALRLAVEITNMRILSMLGAMPTNAALEEFVALAPLTRDASKAPLAGEAAVLEADTAALVALMNTFDTSAREADRAERVWRMTACRSALSAARTPSFARMHKSLAPDETAIVAMLAADTTGVTIAARREGPIILRELDPGIAIFSETGQSLLDIFGKRPGGVERVSIGKARAIYFRLVCDAEASLANPFDDRFADNMVPDVEADARLTTA